jgi:hypothetical protein
VVAGWKRVLKEEAKRKVVVVQAKEETKKK